MKKLYVPILFGLICWTSISTVHAQITDEDNFITVDIPTEHMTTEVAIQVVGEESYSITVPATLQLGAGGEVVLTGNWPETKTVHVTADESVPVTSTSNAALTVDVTVHFDGISCKGDNAQDREVRQPISISTEKPILFGTWTGTVNYYVDIEFIDPYIIPEGGVYYTGLTADRYSLRDYSGYENMYVGGDRFPDTVQPGDVYVYEDWEYRYGHGVPMPYSFYSYEKMADDSANFSTKGWSVLPIGRLEDGKTTFSDMLSFINDVPVRNAHLLYQGMMGSPVEVYTPPVLSSQLTSLYASFTMTELTEMPEIPEYVTNLQQAFDSCYSMKNPKPIPASVTNLETTFQGCTSLEGVLEINAQVGPDDFHNAFYGVDFNTQNLTLTGTCPFLDEIGLTGSNYCTVCNGTCQNNH